MKLLLINNVGLLEFISSLFSVFLFNTVNRFFYSNILGCLIISLIVFTSRTQLVNIRVESPSFERYNLLLSTTTNELSCSCSQISSKYGQFVSYSPRFHQICNSSFNKDFWFVGYIVIYHQEHILYPIGDTYRQILL